MKRLQFVAKYFSTAKKFKFRYASKMIPHPQKAHKGGQDACFAHDNILVVADGVGGWADYGIDPGIYSKRLVELIRINYLKNQIEYINNPEKLIVDSVKLNKQTGTTTICIITLHPETAILKSAYLGDSVYSIFRGQPKKQFYSAPEQQKQFNFPYQVGTDGDDPNQSLRKQLQGQQKDIVVIGSDGLWDNMHTRQIQEKVKTSSNDLVALCDSIAQQTYKYSLSKKYSSPFHQKAKNAKLYYPPIGKSDDITVIVGQICIQ